MSSAIRDPALPFSYSTLVRAELFGAALPAHAAQRVGDSRFGHGGCFIARVIAEPSVVVSVNEDSIAVWDHPAGYPLRLVRFDAGFPSFDPSKSEWGNQHSAAIAPDGSVFFCAVGSSACFVWCFADGLVHSLGETSEPPCRLTTSLDGRYLAALQQRYGARWSGWQARVWSRAERRVVGDYLWRDTYSGASSLADFSFSADGRYLGIDINISAQSGSDWTESNGSEIKDPLGGSGPPPAKPRADDNTSQALTDGRKRILEELGGAVPRGAVRAIATDEHGRYVVTSDVVWDRAEDRRASLARGEYHDTIRDLGFIGGSACRVFWKRQIKRFDVESWRARADVSAGRYFLDAGVIATDGSGVVLIDGRQLELWAAKGWKKRSTKHEQAPQPVHSLAYAPRCARIVGGAGASLIVWDRASNSSYKVSEVLVLPRAGKLPSGAPVGWDDEDVTQVAISDDGRWISAAHRRGLFVLDLATRTGHALWRHTRVRTRHGLAFSRACDLWAAALDDWTIGIWRLDPWMHLASLPGHRGTVMALTFTPDGTELLSGGADGTVLVWDLEGVSS